MYGECHPKMARSTAGGREQESQEGISERKCLFECWGGSVWGLAREMRERKERERVAEKEERNCVLLEEVSQTNAEKSPHPIPAGRLPGRLISSLAERMRFSFLCRGHKHEDEPLSIAVT
jgi:hypothetical protein